jgi:vacuolar-type H+-ATPase subunit I/STV1
MAIIFGMMQMTLGIVINVYNYNHFNKRRSIYTEFIPQITFLMSIFGYLVILIFYKWFADWSEFSPPGLLNTLIYMFLQPGTIAPEDLLYPGQVIPSSFNSGIRASCFADDCVHMRPHHAIRQTLLRVPRPPSSKNHGIRHCRPQLHRRL